ncbi:hypothetical protein KY330_02255 [Candidatus Woesearchaeota archaeon]|nr:hypothetical protein [Candidatus Woesearchaeota archaeon]
MANFYQTLRHARRCQDELRQKASKFQNLAIECRKQGKDSEADSFWGQAENVYERLDALDKRIETYKKGVAVLHGFADKVRDRKALEDQLSLVPDANDPLALDLMSDARELDSRLESVYQKVMQSGSLSEGDKELVKGFYDGLKKYVAESRADRT